MSNKNLEVPTQYAEVQKGNGMLVSIEPTELRSQEVDEN